MDEDAIGDELVDIPDDDLGWMYPGAVRWFTVTGATDASEAAVALGIPALGDTYDTLEHASGGPELDSMKCTSIEIEQLTLELWLVRVFFDVIS